jgi:hypothetical protein
MRMPLTPLTPLTPQNGGGLERTGEPDTSKHAYARIERPVLISLVRSMPDCQSAVLACLTWQAARQQRFSRGQYAGKFVARLSGKQLAQMTGRPLRTVRHSLKRLLEARLIERLGVGPGRTAVCAPTLREAAPAPECCGEA